MAVTPKHQFAFNQRQQLIAAISEMVREDGDDEKVNELQKRIHTFLASLADEGKYSYHQVVLALDCTEMSILVECFDFQKPTRRCRKL